MNRKEELRSIVSQFDLNKHPFYTEWREGSLPMSKLDRYAEDYGHFVGLIAQGWERVGQAEYAQEEREHHNLWLEFADAIRAARKENFAGRPALPETGLLVESARAGFSTSAGAIGALYAFEFQQPDTAQIKLDGLREHYPVGEKGEKYFLEHAGKWHEVEALEAMLENLDDAGYARARAACKLVAEAMWKGLDGVYAEGHA